MTETLLVPIAPGELLDKISILEIKAERIADSAPLANVKHELGLLSELWHKTSLENAQIAELRTQLKHINEHLWQIEDDIRDCERVGDFGETFIKLARAVYQTNDRRAAVKKQINLALGSAIVEEKSYQDY